MPPLEPGASDVTNDRCGNRLSPAPALLTRACRADLRGGPAFGDIREALAEREQAGRFRALPRRHFGRGSRRLDRRRRPGACSLASTGSGVGSGSSGFGCSTTGAGGAPFAAKGR